jgi:uncharacterized protein YjiS (DUF1127 family)
MRRVERTTTLITIETAAKKAASSLSASTLLASAYASAVFFFRRWQTYRELSALDDRTLRDIGLDRSMIASVAREGVRTARDAGPNAERALATMISREPTMLSWLSKGLRNFVSCDRVGRPRDQALPEAR